MVAALVVVSMNMASLPQGRGDVCSRLLVRGGRQGASRWGSILVGPAEADTCPGEREDLKSMPLAAAVGPIGLGSSPAHVTLAAATGGENLRRRVAELGPDERVYLVLRDIRAAEQPGVLYAVYLDLPPGTAPSASHPAYVGTLNFFNVVKLGGAGEAPPPASSLRSYDVTRTLQSLQSQNLLRESPVVTIVPSGSPAPNAWPTIGCIELIKQRQQG